MFRLFSVLSVSVYVGAHKSTGKKSAEIGAKYGIGRLISIPILCLAVAFRWNRAAYGAAHNAVNVRRCLPRPTRVASFPWFSASIHPFKFMLLISKGAKHRAPHVLGLRRPDPIKLRFKCWYYKPLRMGDTRKIQNYHHCLLPTDLSKCFNLIASDTKRTTYHLQCIYFMHFGYITHG